MTLSAKPAVSFAAYRGLWIAWAVVILIAGTIPGGFQGHTHWGNVQWIPFADKTISFRDLLAHFILFVPFGFLGFRSLGQGKHTLLKVVAVTVLFSISVEFYQSLGHLRVPSVTDLIMNVLGVLAGIRSCRFKGWARTQ